MFQDGNALKQDGETVAFCKDQGTARIIAGSLNTAPALIAMLEMYQMYVGTEYSHTLKADTVQMLSKKADEAIASYTARTSLVVDFTEAHAILANGGNRIGAIREVRRLTGMGLKEAKELVETWPEWLEHLAKQEA